MSLTVALTVEPYAPVLGCGCTDHCLGLCTGEAIPSCPHDATPGADCTILGEAFCPTCCATHHTDAHHGERGLEDEG